MSVSRLLQHVFARPGGTGSLAWQLVLSSIAPDAPAARHLHHRPRSRREECRRFSRFEKSHTTAENPSPKTSPDLSASTTPAVSPKSSVPHPASPITDQPQTGSVTLEGWKTRLRTFPDHDLPSSSVRATWEYYCSHVRNSPDVLAKLDANDWFRLLVMLTHDRVQAKTQFLEKADQLLSDMWASGHRADERMFSRWAQHYGIRNLKEAEQFIRMVWWFASPATVSNNLYATLINVLRKLKDVKGAESLFRQAKESSRAQKETVLSMARCYCSLGFAENAIALCVAEIPKLIDDELCGMLIKQCGYDLPDLDEVSKILEWAKSLGVAGSRTYTEVMRAACSLSENEFAEAILSQIAAGGASTSPVTITTEMCNFLLWSYTNAGHDELVASLVNRMQLSSIPLDAVSFEALICGLARVGEVDGAVGIFDRMHEMSPSAVPTVWTYNIILNVLMKGGRIKDALEILERMNEAGLEPDSATYGTLMSGFSAADRPEDALGVFATMMKKGVNPDLSVGVSAMTAYVKLGRPDDGLQCLQHLLNEGHATCIRHWTVLINGYLREGNTRQATELFEELLKRHQPGDVVSFSAFMRYHSVDGEHAAVLAVFKSMLDAGLQPDRIAYNVLIEAHFRAERPAAAFETYDNMVRDGIEPAVDTYSTLITGLARQGDFTGCDTLLQEMRRRNVVPTGRTFAPLVKAFVQRRDAAGVVEYWERMKAASRGARTGKGGKKGRPPGGGNAEDKDEAAATAMAIRGLAGMNELDLALRILRTSDSEGGRVACSSYAVVVEALGRARYVERCEDVYRLLIRRQKDEDGRAGAVRKARAAVVGAVGERWGRDGVRAFGERERRGWDGVRDPDAWELR